MFLFFRQFLIPQFCGEFLNHNVSTLHWLDFWKKYLSVPISTRNASVFMEFGRMCFSCNSLFRALKYFVSIAGRENMSFFSEFFSGLSKIQGTYVAELVAEWHVIDFGSVMADPQTFLNDTNPVQLKFLCFCHVNHHCSDVRDYTSLESFVKSKNLGLSEYIFSSRYRQLFALFRLGSFRYSWQFLSSGVDTVFCRCGERLSSSHVIDFCPLLANSRARLKIICNIPPGDSVYPLFERPEFFEDLFAFLNKIWFLLTGMFFQAWLDFVLRNSCDVLVFMKFCIYDFFSLAKHLTTTRCSSLFIFSYNIEKITGQDDLWTSFRVFYFCFANIL